MAVNQQLILKRNDDVLEHLQYDLIKIKQALWIGELEAVREAVQQVVDVMEIRILLARKTSQ
jgi:hypothetical protein